MRHTYMEEGAQPTKPEAATDRFWPDGDWPTDGGGFEAMHLATWLL